MKGDLEKLSEEQERERKKSLNLYFYFITLVCTSRKHFSYISSLDSVILVSNRLFNLPAVDFYLPF